MITIKLPYYDVPHAFRNAEAVVRNTARDEDGDSLDPYHISLKLLSVKLVSEDFGEEVEWVYEFEEDYS